MCECVCVPVLCSRHREARHWVLGAVVLFNDSDAGDRVRALEVDQMGGGPDARCLQTQRQMGDAELKGATASILSK